MRSVIARSMLLVAIVWTMGCYFEVSSDSKTSSARATPNGLARDIEGFFAIQAGGATVSVLCPSGLTGQQGRRLVCTGTTSDGYALDIAVLERGQGAFRWDVVKSVPVDSARNQKYPATGVNPNPAPLKRTDMRTQVDPTTGQRCITHENGYICVED